MLIISDNFHLISNLMSKFYFIIVEKKNKIENRKLKENKVYKIFKI